MKQLNVTTIVVCGMLALSACNKTDDPPPSPVVKVNATLNGANEVPANPSANTGSVTGEYNKDTKILTLTVTWSGFTATNSHIHKGPAGVAGGVLYGLGTSPFTSPLNYTSPAFTQNQEDSLMNQLYYVNVHSATYPGGEIRGQLIKQ